MGALFGLQAVQEAAEEGNAYGCMHMFVPASACMRVCVRPEGRVSRYCSMHACKAQKHSGSLCKSTCCVCI